jgi:protein-serine/threonine kinase
VRGRSANSAGGVGDLPGIPDLKDVLKVNLPHTLFIFIDEHRSQPPELTSEYQLGMSDLLPPSPTTLYTNMKPFMPASSHLNTSFVPSDGAHLPAANSHVEKSNGIARSLPSPDLHSTFAPPASVPLLPLAHRRDASLHASYPPLPQVRKLDFGALMSSHEETHVELEHIVDDLVQWLSIAESGMTRLLEKPSEDRIEEEAEDIDNSTDIGELQDVDDDKNTLVLDR